MVFEKIMRIGELARRSGLSRDTIRFYERKGLLDSAPSRQKTNTYRDYPEESVERLEMITQARAVGFSVADLQKLTRHLNAMRTRAFDAEGFLDAKIAELRALIGRSEGDEVVVRAPGGERQYEIVRVAYL